MDFLDFDRRHGPMDYPRRVYGRLDTVEPDYATRVAPSYWLYLECVDADWYDHNYSKFIRRAVPLSDILKFPVSIVEFHRSRGTKLHRRIPFEEGKWIELKFTDQPTAYPLNHYLNLFGAPLQRYLLETRSIPPGLEGELEASASMDNIPDSDIEAIREGIRRSSNVTGAIVVDVGQGNCIGLLTRHNSASAVVSLYFDLGGGVLGNVHTFPQDLSGLCFSRDPIVILSHWDWDHWSSAQRFTQALGLKWVVPRQSIGHVHRQFLAHLQQNGNVLVWPRGQSRLKVNSITVERCTGKGRNHSGLALSVDDPKPNPTQRMLFPGDCRYTSIPSGKTPNNAAVVVPHHGGEMRSSYVAESIHGPHCRLVYSYGLGNTYGHPSPKTAAAHMKEWPVCLETRARIMRHGSASGLGHVHLYWNAGEADFQPGCGGLRCPLWHIQR